MISRQLQLKGPYFPDEESVLNGGKDFPGRGRLTGLSSCPLPSVRLKGAYTNQSQAQGCPSQESPASIMANGRPPFSCRLRLPCPECIIREARNSGKRREEAMTCRMSSGAAPCRGSSWSGCLPRTRSAVPIGGHTARCYIDCRSVCVHLASLLKVLYQSSGRGYEVSISSRLKARGSIKFCPAGMSCS